MINSTFCEITTVRTAAPDDPVLQLGNQNNENMNRHYLQLPP